MPGRGERNEQLISESKKLGRSVDRVTPAQDMNKLSDNMQYKDQAEKYLDIAGVIIVVIDSSQKVSFINKKGCDVLGWHRENIIGKNWFDTFIPVEDRDHIKSVFVKLMDGDIEPVEFFENAVLTKEGMERLISWHNTVLTDDNNTIIGTLSSGEDITEQRKFEDRLKKSEKKFKSLYSAMTEGLALHNVIYDKQGKAVDYRIVDINPAYESITGLSRKHALGRRASELYGIGKPPYLDTFEKVAQSGESIFFETYFAPMDKHFSISVFSPDKGKFATVFQDISGRKKAEKELKRLNRELEAKNKELEQIVNATSHDFRSPLINIDGFSKRIVKSLNEIVEILQGSGVSLETREKINSIIEDKIKVSERFVSQGIQKMDSLLSGLLQLSRLGRIELHKEKLDMNSMITHIAETVAFQIQQANAKVEISQLPPCSGDAAQINQVFSNLIGNAIKNLDPLRQGIIRISGTIDKERSIYCVEDNGIGIAPEHQEKIFDLFYKLRPDTDTGSGLGLSIVQNVLNRHDGKIWLESEPEKGSKFVISLPKE